jgi:ABC-2 type transport system ATP-binding protein
MTHDVGRVPALRADRLGKRYGHTWGLRDCTFEVPPGSIVGLVGPNGAGKTTLLALTVGLLAPTEGQVALFGEPSRAQDAATLARVSYLAQEHPLYRGFTVADMFRFGRSLNPSWDAGLAAARMAALDIPLRRKVKSLSGGQQAQVALTMALAKRAPLLLLDEPVASLDPLARLDFMRDVVAASAESGLTVLIASHVIAELERLCDWLLVLNGGRLQLAGAVDDLVAGHAVLTVPRDAANGSLPGRVIERTDSDRQSTVLVSAPPGAVAAAIAAPPPGWAAEPAGFEPVVLAYLWRPRVATTTTAGAKGTAVA